MTPERKKKLRLLLRRKAAEQLKAQQEVKAGERKRVITQRTGEKKNLDSLSDGESYLYNLSFATQNSTLPRITNQLIKSSHFWKQP